MTIYEIAKKIANDIVINNQSKSLSEIQKCLENEHYIEFLNIEEYEEEDLDELYYFCEKLIKFNDSPFEYREVRKFHESLSGPEKYAFELLYAINVQEESKYDPSWKAFNFHIKRLNDPF